MEARSSILRVFSIFAITLPLSTVASASIVQIYRAEFNSRPIPSAPNQSKGWMNDAVIEIADHFIIHDLDTRIVFTHTSLYDLQIDLQGPAGNRVNLSAAGNLSFITRDNNGRLTTIASAGELYFDDQADVSIEDAGPPYSGPFRPASALACLNGQDISGRWKLKIYDAFYSDTGKLESFELIIQTPEPATIILLMFGIFLMMIFRHHKKK